MEKQFKELEDAIEWRKNKEKELFKEYAYNKEYEQSVIEYESWKRLNNKLLNIIYQYYDKKHSVEICEELRDALDDLYELKNNDLKFIINKIQEIIIGISTEVNICPKCSSELTNKTYKEYHLEVDDRPYEEFIETVCENCGYENE